MRLFGFRVPFFVAVLSVGIGSTVWALGHNRAQVETVYLGPVTTTLTVPTSYLVTSSWVEPSSYVLPTSYATAYVTDPIAVVQPTYLSTAYIRRGLFGRRWLVERPVYASYRPTYLSTSYAVPLASYPTRSYTPTVLTDPMVWPSTYVASADCVCPERVALGESPSRMPSGTTTSPRGGTGSRTLQSEPASEGAMPSDVGLPPGEGAPVATPGRSANAGTGETVPPNPRDASSGTDNTPSPPPVPRPPADQPKRTTEIPSPVNPGLVPVNPANPPGTATVRQTQPSPTSAVVPQAPTNPNATNSATPSAPPTAPGQADDLGPPNPTGESRRQSLRPAFPSRPFRPENRNGILFGMVQSSAAGEPEEGVRVSVTNAFDQGRDKATMTDAFGRFSMRLAEGEWTVHVTMPSGRVYPVSEVRVSNGQISDSLGRRVPSLEITR